MKILNTLLLLFFFLLIQCTPSYIGAGNTDQTENTDSHNKSNKLIKEPGKCYAKCLISDLYRTDFVDYVVYTGSLKEEINDVEIEEVKIQIKPASTTWVKRMADRNCLSADPDDCLV